MTVDQFTTAFFGLTNRVYDPRTFRITSVICALLLAVIKRTIQVVDGQPNLSPIVFTTLDDAVTQIRLLGSPTNGHKLLLPAPVVRLVVALLYRTALNESGQIIAGTYAVNAPSTITSAAGSSATPAS